MLLKKRFEFLLIVCFLIFSWWLMSKSFSYKALSHEFNIGRNEVGDFGLHLSLIRSFSLGNNLPPESPFFSGKPLPYHYFLDLLVGFLEKLGLRIDIAFNGISALFFSLLLFTIYKITQWLFIPSKILGLLAVFLFLFPSSFMFVDFFTSKDLSWKLFSELWTLPDYLHKGPFDGSLISIYFTPAVWLNQRHLIAAMSIGLGTIYWLLKRIDFKKPIHLSTLITVGILFGGVSRVHSLVFLSTLIVLTLVWLVFKKNLKILFFIIPAMCVAIFLYWDVLRQGRKLVYGDVIHLGFLSSNPFTLYNFVSYWFANIGISLLLIPLGFIFSGNKQRKIFLCFITLFIIANTIQFSFRIEHNHSILNFFFTFTTIYVAYALYKLWSKKLFEKAFVVASLFLFFMPGILNLIAVKNDFQFPVKDAPADRFMEWIKNNTWNRSIFLSPQNLYDPVTLSGRRSYLGATYYVQVMGYDYASREQQVKTFFEATNTIDLIRMRNENIHYIVLPKSTENFPYKINNKFFSGNLPTVYEDENVKVYKL